MESKVISLRVPEAILKELDSLASKRYPNRKGNRTAIILDAIALLLDDPKSEFDNTSYDSVNSQAEKLESFIEQRIEEKISEFKTAYINDKNTLYDDVNKKLKQFEEKLLKSADTSNEEPPYNSEEAMNINEALELAKSRGFKGTKKTFSGNFTKNKKNPDYLFKGIRRVIVGVGKPSLYFDEGDSGCATS